MHTQANYRTTRMPLITFIPIPTKFVEGRIPTVNRCTSRCGSVHVRVLYVPHSVEHSFNRTLTDARRCACKRVSGCACLPTRQLVSLLKCTIVDNPQIDRNLDDKALLCLDSSFARTPPWLAPKFNRKIKIDFDRSTLYLIGS